MWPSAARQQWVYLKMRVYHVFPYPWYVAGGHANAARTFIECQVGAGIDVRAVSPAPDPARLRHPVPQVDISAGRGTVMQVLRAHVDDAPPAAGEPDAQVADGKVLEIPPQPCPVTYLDYETADWEALVARLLGESDNPQVVFHLHHLKQCAGIGRVLRRRGVPYVYTSHGELHIKGPQSFVKKFAFVNFFSRLVRGAAAIHVLTERERDALKYLIPAYRGPLFVIPNIVELPPDLAQIEAAPRSRFGLPDDAFVFLFFGRLDIAQKGLDVLVDAFARVVKNPRGAGCRLAMIGPDFRGNREQIRAQARQLGVEDRVHLIDGQYGRDKWAALKAGDLFVSPSRWEGFGIAIAEAMGAGVPTLTAETANLSTELHRRGAAAVSRLDADDLAGHMLRLRQDPALLNELAARGQQWVVAACSAAGAAAQFQECYRAALRRGTRRGGATGVIGATGAGATN